MGTIKCTVKDAQEIQPGNLVRYCKDKEGNLVYSNGFPCIELANTAPVEGVLVEMKNGKAVVQVSNVPRPREEEKK